jgi:hypothetical protein
MLAPFLCIMIYSTTLYSVVYVTEIIRARAPASHVFTNNVTGNDICVISCELWGRPCFFTASHAALLLFRQQRRRFCPPQLLVIELAVALQILPLPVVTQCHAIYIPQTRCTSCKFLQKFAEILMSCETDPQITFVYFSHYTLFGQSPRNMDHEIWRQVTIPNTYA